MFQPKRQKTGGRQKGSTNKTNQHLRQLIGAFLEDNFEQVKTDFESLSARDKIKAYTELISYALPKLSAVSTSLDYDSLTEAQLDDLLQKLLHNDN